MKLYTNPTLELKDRTNRMMIVGILKAHNIEFEIEETKGVEMLNDREINKMTKEDLEDYIK